MSNHVMKRLPNAKLYYVFAALAKFTFTLTALVELFYFSAYLTDTAMFSNGMIAVILGVTSVVDLVASFFISVFLEAFNLPWGKIRSWLLIAPPIVIVFYTITFYRISANEVVSGVVIIIGFIISHLLWNIAEAASNSMSMVATDDPDERTNFSLWLGRGANFAVLPFAAIAAFLLNKFNMISPSISYAGLTFVMSVCYLVGFWILFFATGYTHDKAARKREKKEAADAPKSSPIKNLVMGFKYSFTNKHLVITIITLCVVNCANSMMSASLFYIFNSTFFGYTLINMSVFILLQGIFKLVGSLAIPPIFLKIFNGNKKMVYDITLLLQGALAILAYLLIGNPTVSIFVLLFSHFFAAVPMCMYLSLYQDCAVYSEYKSGKDVTSFIMGMSVMPIKVGNAFKSFVLSAFLVGIGYTATAADPSIYGKDFAFLHMLLCGIICIVAFIAHFLIYKLPDADVAKMLKHNNERRALAAAGMPDAEEDLHLEMDEVDED